MPAVRRKPILEPAVPAQLDIEDAIAAVKALASMRDRTINRYSNGGILTYRRRSACRPAARRPSPNLDRVVDWLNGPWPGKPLPPNRIVCHIRADHPEAVPDSMAGDEANNCHKASVAAFDRFNNEPRWVAWRQERRKAGGKLTKQPYNPHNSKKAKANDPNTWGTRSQAEHRATQLINGKDSGGIGIQLGDLGEGTYLAGIDIDSCFNVRNSLEPWAESFLAALRTYAERSPSGTGVKVFFRCASEDIKPFLKLIGAKPWGVKRAVGEGAQDHGPAVEIYFARRYFTVTESLLLDKPDEIALLDWAALERLSALVPPARRAASEGVGDAPEVGRQGGAWARHPSTNAILPNKLVNVKRALTRLKVRARHDLFANRMLVTIGSEPERALDDATSDRLWLKIEEVFGWRPQRELFDTVLRDMAHGNGFHPVCEYLAGLQWDGKQRLDNWLFTYGKVPRRDSAYNRYVATVGRIMLVAAVRRVRRPGCKFDEMLVLVTETQGLDKSTALATLAIRPEWFTDSLDLGARDKEAIEQLEGKWVVEIAELHGRRRNDIDRIKSFLSRTSDRARLAYGRYPTERPRHNVFFGSTNDTKFLQDRTGNRRFWPIFGAEFDIEALQRDRDQLWAEAVAAEAAGESIRLPEELWPIAGIVQSEALEEEPWVEVLSDALGDLAGKIRATDVWTILGIDPKHRTSTQDNRMGAAMRELGWERKQRRYGHGPEWGYVKGQSERQIIAEREEDGALFVDYADNMRPEAGQERTPAAAHQNFPEPWKDGSAKEAEDHQMEEPAALMTRKFPPLPVRRRVV